MDNPEIFFNRVESICTYAEESIGTDLFLKLTLHKGRPSFLNQSLCTSIKMAS